MTYRKTLMVTMLVPVSYIANAADKEIQDMSDPLAVFTQVGGGITDKGLNLKIGQTYDTGDDDTAAMNVLEVKGFFGEALGWRGSSERDNSIDSIRWRNFNVNLTNGLAAQFDVNYTFDDKPGIAEQSLDASYSVIQALPKLGNFNFYPLAGLGTSLGNNATEDDGSIDSGYSIMGVYATVGMYSKYQITDKIWFNYNPIWLTTIGGSNNYDENYYGGHSHLLTHEVILSYQITPRFNVRYFANFNENTDFASGEHRIEFNYQI